VLLAKRVPEHRRAPAATIVWMMMIVGFAVTAGVAGKLLDPYSPARLVAVTASACALAFAIALLALRGLEGEGGRAPAREAPPKFIEALKQVWSEADARRFTIFIFVSMLAYSAQDLILEPFAGTVFGYTPGQSTSLSGVQHAGVLVGMILVALAGQRLGSLRAWTVGGCIASALALASLVGAAAVGAAWPFRETVFLLGVSNGAFSIAAIGSMMRLASQGREGREGVRMGLWGAGQALAFGLGGLVGTGASDLARWLLGSPAAAYATVFAFEALLFIAAAWLAARIDSPRRVATSRRPFVEPAVVEPR
jgi:BCD family chlorophyll transporter-like MFS transporter